MTADTVLAALRRRRFSWTSERELQDGIAEALADLPVHREVVISEADRIDFLVGRVGIEVKIGGSLAGLTRQLSRYAQSPAIDVLIVVAGKLRLSALPESLNGKPIHVVSLWGGAL